jgi:hypothetical protein
MYHYFVYLDLVFYKYLCECIHKRGTDFGFFPICGKDNMDKKKRERERERNKMSQASSLLLLCGIHQSVIYKIYTPCDRASHHRHYSEKNLILCPVDHEVEIHSTFVSGVFCGDGK